MEVRNPELFERKIKAICPKIFWRKCKICGYEFRGTTMWRWIDNWGWEGEPYTVYACTSCIPDYKDIFEHISGYIDLDAAHNEEVEG